ncbi:MAG: hypothetical protein HZA49_00675 [Planctomycetes bacterium]|nr:hypothetical protein [Planctomycetota bacterium]
MVQKKELFGEVAVRLGLATKLQVKSALKKQKELKEKRLRHRLIGLIMLDMDILDTTGLIMILKEINGSGILN